jgi:putative endonuclease
MVDGALPKSDNKSLGVRGEEIAVAFLKGRKYTVVERNFRCKGGEVDIIARDGKTLVFVEVKARRNAAYGPPQLAVTPFKQRQISKAALTWLAKNRLQDACARFDVIAILLRDHDVPDIEHFQNAFELAY